MILYGRYFSPFARRVGVWMMLQGRDFEHVPLPPRGAGSEELAEINPLLRIPALRLDDGKVLIDSFAIVDWLEDSAPPDRRLLPASGDERRGKMQLVALAHTLAEKTVSLAGERLRRPAELQWANEIARMEMQLATSLEIMEALTAETALSGLNGAVDGATVAFVTAYDFTTKVFPSAGGARYPQLAALSRRANVLPAFASTQP